MGIKAAKTATKMFSNRDIWTCILNATDPFSRVLLRMTCKQLANWIPKPTQNKQLMESASVNAPKTAVRLNYPLDRLLSAIAKYGRVSDMIYVGKLISQDNSLAKKATKHGNIETLTYLLSLDWQDKTELASIAAAFGQLECLKLIYENGSPTNPFHIMVAAENGHLNCLQYLWEKNSFNTDSLLWCAARHYDCLVYLLNQHCVIPERILCCAASNLKSTILLRSRNCAWYEDYCCSAIENNSVECFDYAVANHCPYNRLKLLRLAASRSLYWVQRVWDLGPKIFDIEVAINAAGVGALDILQFLYKQGYIFDADVMAKASSHYDCLVYLHSLNCPWDRRVTAYARSSGSITCLLYAIENGCANDMDALWL